MSYNGELLKLRDEYTVLGRNEALLFRPPSDATQPDNNETTLENQARGWVSEGQSACDAKVGESLNAAIEIQQKSDELSGRSADLIRGDGYRGQAEVELAAAKAECIQTVVTRLRKEVQWNGFRSEHNIKLDAHYPDSKIYASAAVILCGFGETIANTFFFENQNGLLGGFVVAFIVSLINLGGAFGLGFLARFKNLASPKYVVALGWVAIAAFIVISVYGNAIFSAFRSEYQLVEDPSSFKEMSNAFQDAMRNTFLLFTQAQVFKDFWSAVLFALGVILSIFAFSNGYRFSDRYPGHERLHRELLDAQEDEEQRYKDLRERLGAQIQRSEAEVQGAMQEPTALSNLAGTRMSDVVKAKADMLAAVTAVQRDFSAVLSIYRQTNLQVRGSLQPPAYFQFTPEMHQHCSVTFADETASKLMQLQMKMAELRDRFQNSLSQKLEEMRAHRTQLLTKRFDEYKISILLEAQAEIERLTALAERAKGTVREP